MTRHETEEFGLDDAIRIATAWQDALDECDEPDLASIEAALHCLHDNLSQMNGHERADLVNAVQFYAELGCHMDQPMEWKITPLKDLAEHSDPFIRKFTRELLIIVYHDVEQLDALIDELRRPVDGEDIATACTVFSSILRDQWEPGATLVLEALLPGQILAANRAGIVESLRGRPPLTDTLRRLSEMKIEDT